jgi:hypothetical protein
MRPALDPVGFYRWPFEPHYVATVRATATDGSHIAFGFRFTDEDTKVIPALLGQDRARYLAILSV